MKKKYKKLQLNFKRNLIYLVIITTMIVSAFSISRFKSTYPMKDATKIAVMANNVQTNITNLNGYPGYTVICPIILENSVDDKICEVSESFFINITSFGNIPLELTLYNDETCSQILKPNENGIYENEDFIFKAGIAETKKYFLKIKWPQEYNSPDYAFEVDGIMLNILVNQVD